MDTSWLGLLSSVPDDNPNCIVTDDMLYLDGGDLALPNNADDLLSIFDMDVQPVVASWTATIDTPIPATQPIQSGTEIDLSPDELEFFKSLDMPLLAPIVQILSQRGPAKRLCMVDNCTRHARTKGMCSHHRATHAPANTSRRLSIGGRCTASGCTRGAIADGVCRKHGGVYRSL
ncbi:hypothetical protein H310_06571 [Aphanomyces invadans]|uniref:Uncharacterized protein n=1 Tax=Aphanomyces invadans TaxID=157072 RepID=A0A024U5R4_9STRA|nr:hypothetical protein H310_06571 [Aphanomyces invadans]ETW00913.1 hypothetical protein H310_06571 [Aphanomyces invadans]|eukprot:XP_008869911.1 hypothetical protein H310_06571 [Aphanomyces invadans]